MKRKLVTAIVSSALIAHPGPLEAQDTPGPAAVQATTHPGRITYASNADGDFEIFVMRADGTRRRQITHNRVDDVDPSWAPDGTRIVFERDTRFYGDDLYIAELGGGAAVPWIVTEDEDEGNPRWSPDGEWIAYRSHAEFDDSDVFLTRLDKSDGSSIFARAENGSVSYPAWSPDSSKVAFIEHFDGSAIRVVEACCTSGPEHGAVATEWSEGLDWSPDGSCLVFGDVVPGRGYDLHTAAADGGAPRAITRGRADAYPGSWSPDASQIVYDSNARGSWDIYVIDADGGNPRPLTNTPAVHEITPDWWGPAVAEPAAPPCGETTAPQATPAPSAS